MSDDDPSVMSTQSSPSSPNSQSTFLHLSVPSARAFGAATRLVTSETRLPQSTNGNDPSMTFSEDEKPDITPPNMSDLPYDLSYPSPATWTSSLPRGILRRRPHAPPNTPESTPLNRSNHSPTKSVRFEDFPLGDLEIQRIQGADIRDHPAEQNWMTSDDHPIPQPQYNVVRPWLKDVMRSTFGRHQSAPSVFFSPTTTSDTSYTDASPEQRSPKTPTSSFLMHFQDLSLHPDRPPSMSPTETSLSDPLNDTSRITWSQMEMEVEDPDWSFEPIMSAQDALKALCEYGSDEDDTDSVLCLTSPSQRQLLASPFPPPNPSTPTKQSFRQPTSPEGHSPGASPKLPLKFSSPLPSRYVRGDADSPSPFKPFYSWSK